MSLKERIKQLRKALGMTQQKFADAIGVKQNTVAQYEIGRNEPIDSVVNLICKEYNVNHDWLRNGVGEMFIYTATFSLDEYARVNKLNKTEISIIRGFMELDPATRQAIYNIFVNAFNENNSDRKSKELCGVDSDLFDNVPDDPEELERMFPPVENSGTNAC